jgi:hypothetical protein
MAADYSFTVIGFRSPDTPLDCEEFSNLLKHLSELLVRSSKLHGREYLRLGVDGSLVEKNRFELIFSFQNDEPRENILPIKTINKNRKIFDDLVHLLSFVRDSSGQSIIKIRQRTEYILELTMDDQKVKIVSSDVYRLAIMLQTELKRFFEFVRGSTISSIEFRDVFGHPIFCSKREEIPSLKELPKFFRQEKKAEQAFVTVVKAGFEKNLVWDILYQNQKYAVYITDHDFWEDLKSGKITLSQGVKMFVEMEITERFDLLTKTRSVADIEILRVIEVRKKWTQPGLFDGKIDDFIPGWKQDQNKLGSTFRLNKSDN